MMRRAMQKAWLIFSVCVAVCSFGLCEEAPKSKIAAVLQPIVDDHALAGAVAVVLDKDKVISQDVVGFSDIENKTPMKVNDLFWIASMSKPITATLLMMLVDERKVKLDDPIANYLPEFKGQMVVAEKDADHVLLRKPAKVPTIRMALNHTAGLIDRAPLEDYALDTMTLKERTISYGMSPLRFEPGTKFQYNNPGINTVGRIIEVVSGMSFEVFLQTRLLDPLGMKETTFWPSDEQVKRLAKTYRPNKEKTALEPMPIGFLSLPYTNRARRAFPGGGLFSTGQDLAIFCRMILNGGELSGKRYVSADAIKQMGSVQTEGLEVNPKNPHDGGAYGLGWFVVKVPAPEVSALSIGTFGHAGAYQTIMWIDPVKSRAYILLMQHNGHFGSGWNARPGFLKAAAE